ncbi:MAG TPA: PH domain-containing protein [Candidatus Limnocylindria bacterium]|nr:PH domain-containing protein [Candidatus Limnocylindria bacterium]
MSQTPLNAPGGIIYEPGERTLAVGRPFAWWVLLLAIALVLALAAAWAASQTVTSVAAIALASALLVIVVTVVRWVEWISRVWVLTDRRVIARSGILNRTQAAVLLERIQDASLTRPFPASLFADYGILKLETAGLHSQERVTEGLQEIAITGASRFYAQLTDALTPER